MPTNTTRHRKKQQRRKHTRKFKRMNCNPGTSGKTSVADSCLTNDVLIQLKASFNESHPNKQIVATNPKSIWTELKKKLKTCDKEDCWLDTIADPLVRRKLDKQSFAPDHPLSWNKDPDEWLSNFDIADVLKQYEETYSNFVFLGPTPIDFDTRLPENGGDCVWEELCKFQVKNYLESGKTKIGIVFNLDHHNQGGSHWVSMFVDLEDQYMFYMDSAGDTIPPEIDALAKRIIAQGLDLETPMHIHFHENCPMEHQYGNNECGMYSLYFIVTMLTNKTEKKIFKNYMEKIAFFKNKRIPDKYMHHYRKKYFNS